MSLHNRVLFKCLLGFVVLLLAQFTQVANAKGAYRTGTTPGISSPNMLSPKALAQWGCVNSVEYKNHYAWFSCAGLLEYAPNTNYGQVSKYWWGYYYNGSGPYPYYAIQWDANAYPQNKSLNCCQVETMFPIQFGTGNKKLIESDITSGVLKFQRIYNSIDSSNLDSFGAGWSHEYDRHIATPRSDATMVRRPNGAELSFTLDVPTQTWVGDADVNDRLVELKDASGNRTGWRHFVADQSLYENYNASGVLQSVQSTHGSTRTMIYTDGTNGSSSGNGGYVLDSAGNPTTTTLPAGILLRIVDDFGHALIFGYDIKSRVVVLNDSGSNQIKYNYDSIGNLVKVTYPDGKSRTYLYGESAYIASGSSLPSTLTGVVDEDGIRCASYWYNAQGRASDEKIAEGSFAGVGRSQLAYTINGSGIVTSTSVVGALSETHAYTFSLTLGVNRPTLDSRSAGTGFLAATSSKVYDANGNVTSNTDYNGAQSTYGFDLTRNLQTTRTEAVGTPKSRIITTQWHATFRQPSQTDEPGKRSTFTYDSNGNLLTRTVLDTATNESRTWTYTYSSLGQVLTIDGPRTDVSDVTTYTYYNCATGAQCGQIQTIANALNQVTTYTTYNANGQPLTITDPNGVITTLTYDTRMRLTSRTTAGETTSFEYFPTGLIKKVILPDNSFIAYTYDNAHRLTQVQDNEGNKVVYMLDAMGNRTAENVYDPSNALTNTHTRIFNTLNRLSQEITATGTPAVTTMFAYDNSGNQISINAPLSRNTTNQYDELNRLKQVTDPLGGNTLYGYNALDQLISVTDPRNKVTNYTYNALGDLLTQVSSDTGTTTNTYDSGGNLKTKTDARSALVTYSYDMLNRVTQAVTSDQTIQYHYDLGTNGKGRLSDVTDNSGLTSWTYESHGRVASKTQTMGAITQTTSYAFDSSSRLSTMTFPSGHTIGYGYTNGKLTSLIYDGSTTILANVLYEPFGPVRGWTWGNSTLATRVHDTDGKLIQLDSAGAKTFSYDDAFRMTQIADLVDSSKTQSYGYDLLDRLTSATGTGLNQSFTYDANGNRLTQGGASSSTYTISSTSNRLNSVTGALTKTYTYDNAGNITGDGSATFTFDQQGRMGTSTKAGLVTSYSYNAMGQRVRKSNSNQASYFVYDEAGHVIGEYDDSGNLIQEMIWLGDIPVATIRTDQDGSGVGVFYIHGDHLGAPAKITRPADNAVIWKWDHDPFGNGTPNEDPDGNGRLLEFNFAYPGQYRDKETEMSYNMARYYDSAIGGYTTSDPIGLAGGSFSTYRYANNPISFSDPSGLFLSSVHAVISANALQGFGFDPGFMADAMAASAGLDFVPESQDPANAPWHSMTPPDGSMSDAFNRSMGFVHDQLKRCDATGLGYALHILQDSTARGHRYKEYRGLWDLFWNHPSHFADDTWSNKNEYQEALIKSQNAIRQFKEQCGCAGSPRHGASGGW